MMWKIAIIDDERQVLQGMKRAIPWEELGAEWAGEALNGEDGLAMIRATSPDIVITDIYMPVMSGLEMMEQLRNEGFKGKNHYSKRLFRLRACQTSPPASGQ
ncbi:response regulator [Paenibacillus rhizoplanae]